MPHVNFGPTKTLTGGAAFVKLTNDNSVIFTVFKQIANNQNKRDNFDFKTGINVKFSTDEVGAIVRAVRTNGRFDFYHQSERDGQKNVTKGSFSYYFIKAKDQNSKDKEGFGLTVTKGEDTRKVGYSIGSAEVLAEFLKYCLTYEFDAILKEDEKRDQEYLAKKNAAQKPAETAPKKAKKVKEEEKEEDPFSDEGQVEEPNVEGEKPEEDPWE